MRARARTSPPPVIHSRRAIHAAEGVPAWATSSKRNVRALQLVICSTQIYTYVYSVISARRIIARSIIAENVRRVDGLLRGSWDNEGTEGTNLDQRQRTGIIMHAPRSSWRENNAPDAQVLHPCVFDSSTPILEAKEGSYDRQSNAERRRSSCTQPEPLRTVAYVAENKGSEPPA